MSYKIPCVKTILLLVIMNNPEHNPILATIIRQLIQALRSNTSKRLHQGRTSWIEPRQIGHVKFSVDCHSARHSL